MKRSSFFLICVVLALPLQATEIWRSKDGKSRTSLDAYGKGTRVISHAPGDPILYPERATSTSLLRVRFELNTLHRDWINSEAAYEQRVRYESEDAGMGGAGATLPSVADAPFRVGQLDWEIAEDDVWAYRHEIDRALVALHPVWGEAVIGRQAIGLGRGTLFGAVDVFAPFSPTEVDRDWRRGVDASRVEYRLSDNSSAELIAAFGEDTAGSALLCRFRGYLGDIDGEIIAGKRGKDGMYALVISSSLHGAELHLELAAFEVPNDWPDGGIGGSDRLVGKAVSGASYTFSVGKGLTLMGEYHYSGFGVEDIDDVLIALADPDYQERYLRGDTQILGQHAVGLSFSYPASDEWLLGLLLLGSPEDGSGVGSPSLYWDLSDSMSLSLSIFAPWGDEPENGQLQSEYGGSPRSFFLQYSLYY